MVWSAPCRQVWGSQEGVGSIFGSDQIFIGLEIGVVVEGGRW